MKTHRIVYKSAINGRFVSRAFAEQNPNTTVSLTVKISARTKK